MTYARYNLTDQQAAFFATLPTTAAIMAILSKQPPEGWYLEHEDGNSVVFSEPDNPGNKVNIKPPFPTGEVGLREAWRARYYYLTGKYYQYKADWGENEPDDCLVGWYSAQCMPPKAIRHHYRVTDSRVCRVREVTYNDIESMGYTLIYDQYLNPIDSTFRQSFTARYSTPRPVIKGGIERYRCYAWDKASAIKRLVGKYSSAIPDTWKDKPLEIIINPYVQVAGIERIEP